MYILKRPENSPMHHRFLKSKRTKGIRNRRLLLMTSIIGQSQRQPQIQSPKIVQPSSSSLSFSAKVMMRPHCFSKPDLFMYPHLMVGQPYQLRQPYLVRQPHLLRMAHSVANTSFVTNPCLVLF